MVTVPNDNKKFKVWCSAYRWNGKFEVALANDIIMKPLNIHEKRERENNLFNRFISISFFLFVSISVVASSFMGTAQRYSFADCWTIHIYIGSTLSRHSSSTLRGLDTANQISAAQRFRNL